MFWASHMMEATALECTWIHRQLNGDYWLFFGVPGGDVHLLEIGAQFDTMYSGDWSKVRWEVIEAVHQHGKHKGEWGRFYRVVMERSLDADECAVWQQYIENWEAGNE